MPQTRHQRFLLSIAATFVVLLNGCRENGDDAAARSAEAIVAHSAGVEFLTRDQLPEAEAEFQKVIELAPRDPVGHANLALTYLRAGRFEEAERHLESARELAPDRPDVALLRAKVYALTGKTAESRAVLEEALRTNANDARVLYALAELEAQTADRASPRRQELLEQVRTLQPTNLPVRLQLVDIALRRGDADSAIAQLEELRRLPLAPPSEAEQLLQEMIRSLRARSLDQARASLDRLIRTLEFTLPYQAALNEVAWVEGPLVGRPILTFEPQSLIAELGTGRPVRAASLEFVDATSEVGLPEAAKAPIAFGDVDGDGRDDLLAGSRLYRVQRDNVSEINQKVGLNLNEAASVAAIADIDNDGWLDLFVVTAGGPARLLGNNGNGTLADVTSSAGTFDVRGVRQAVFVDLDHDGDLDLLLAGRERRLVYRNNLDGTFRETTAAMGLAGSGDAHSVRFADFDNDGRIDLFIAHADRSDALFRNLGGGRFADVTGASGVTSDPGSGGAAIGDYDNDGLIDIVVSRVNAAPILWRNGGRGVFTRDTRSAAALQNLRGVAGGPVELADFDNDGWLDLALAGTGGLVILRNDGTGKFENRIKLVASAMASPTSIALSDVDDDGDQDLVIADATGARLLRNEGGNARLASRLQLAALRTGSGKNNTFGIGARVELRAGEIHQTRVVTSRTTHFGLGSHLKADVIRIEWPNGVPQFVYLPGTDADVLEEQQLKGSCPFLYTWDGKRFRFVTDLMWSTALGMPLGIMASGATAYGPPGPAREYLRIPGDAMQPKDGRYVLQFTEELWETAYVDEMKLLAVDHPDSVQVFVNERFVPPGPGTLRMFPIVRPRAPKSAVDDRGNDVLPALREHDDVYVSDLTPLEYQGIVEPHDLVLDLDDEAGQPGTFLFLRGWIFPTDASINVALMQRSDLAIMNPRLEVRDARGQWTTAIANVGFPAGKNKTVIVDLNGIFPTRDRHVRIRTNMQIYWDQAFVATEVAGSAVRVNELERGATDLHFRGFSRMYRKGGRYGPHWFDYEDVRREQPWRPIAGAFTRYGDVSALLQASDNRYVIMTAGDEMTVEFDASSAAPLPKGWTRTFLVNTIGWLKDSDLNTALGTTVEPLPFHGIRHYPYAAGESYPADSALLRYRRDFNTRIIRQR